MTFELIDQAFKLFQTCYRLSENDPRNMRLHHLADRAWQRYKRRLIIWTHHI